MASKRYKFTRMAQRGGDDGYQWCVDVLVNGRWVEKVNGCVRREAQSYRDQFEREEATKKVSKQTSDPRCDWFC